MTAEELAKSPVIKMAGSDGHIYETTADRAHELAEAAKSEGVELKAFDNPEDFGQVKEDYFSSELLKAGATRFAIGIVNPWDWVRGIGTAAGTGARGFVKGTVGTLMKAAQGATYLGESITNAFTGDDDHRLSKAIGGVNDAMEKGLDMLTPDLFEKTGEYDGIEGAKEATGAARGVAEMVANVKGIGALTKTMQASGAAAKAAHAMTGALFGAGKYGEVASDENGTGGAAQQAAALVAGAADAVIFGLWNPFKIGEKYLKSMKPFIQATRMEAAKRFLAQATNSGLSMATVEAVKQGAEATAAAGRVFDESGWGERTFAEVMKSIGAQFLVGSAFVALDVIGEQSGRPAWWWRKRRQEKDLSGEMKVAMSYQVERNRRAVCPKYHDEAVYAFNRFKKQGGRAEDFREGLSQAPDVRRVNEDGSVLFDDGAVWRVDAERGGATITISDGTILSETGELLGMRARREAGVAGNAAPEAETISEPIASGASEPRKIIEPGDKPESNALLLLEQIDEGRLPAEEVALGDVEPIAPTENGNVIEKYDPEKAKPIIVWEDFEGNRHAVTGGKRLAMAGAAGAETVKAVVVRESDGWTSGDAYSLGAIENLREGRVTIRNVVDAVDTVGEDRIAELAGWHQKMGSGEAATTLRRGLAVANKAAPEIHGLLRNEAISEDFAYNVAQALSMERVGASWETAQKAVADLAGKVGPEELDAVLWGLRERLSGTDGASGGPEPLPKDGATIDWNAAVAEERAKYNAKKGGKDGSLDSDAILMETEDGELKTLGEMEAALNEPRNGAGQGNPEGAQPLYQAAEGAAINKAAELRPVEGKDGTFTSLSHPEARFTIDGSTHTIAVDGLTTADFEPSRIEQTAALVAKVEAHAATHGLKIGFYDDTTRALWETVKKNIRLEGHEAYSSKRMEAKRQTLIEHLSKSGLAAEVVDNLDGFNKMLTESGGEALKKGEEIYGFVDPKTKKVYLNPEFFKSSQAMEAPLHEFGHLGIIACEKTNKAVYDKGMKLAAGFLENPESAGNGAIREIVETILNDRVYSKQGKTIQAEELLAQLIGKRGADALKAETDKSVIAKVKSWLVEFWNGFGKALGLKDITPEEAERMTLEDVADAIRAEMLGGGKYGEGFKAVEFAEGGARTATKPERVKRRLTGRQKAVNEFVSMMGGGDDPTNTDTDLLALWVDNGGRLFDKLPFEETARYTKGAKAKKTRSAVADEFAESTAFYKDLTPAQRRVYFGTEKLETGAIGEGLKEKLEAAGITRFTREDGTIDYEAAIEEFERQWTNYERGGEILKERSDYDEARAKAFVEEMERAEAAEREAGEQISAEEAEARDRAAESGFMFSRAIVGNSEVAIADNVAAMESLNPKDPKSVEKYLLDHLEDNIQMLQGGHASITSKSAKHYAWSKVRGFDGRQMRQARAKAATVIRDLIEMFSANGNTRQPAKPGKSGIAWRCRLPIGLPRLDNSRNVIGGVVYDADVVIKDEGHGKFFYDISHLKRNGTLTGQLDKQAKALFGAQHTALPPSQAGSASGVPTAQSIPNSGAGAQGGVRWSRGGIFTGTAADYANRSREGGKDDGPSLKKIGTGEGSHVYGWGLYGSTKKSVAMDYATADANRKRGRRQYLVADVSFDGKPARDNEKLFDEHLGLISKLEDWGSVDTVLRNYEFYDSRGKLRESEKEDYEFLKKNLSRFELKENKPNPEHLYEQTWFTNREPGDESHLLKWYEPVSKETWDIIREGVKAIGDTYEESYIDRRDNSKHKELFWKAAGVLLERDGTPVYPDPKASKGQSFYKDLATVLHSPKAASEYLAKIGIDGVKYPVDSYGKTVKDGEKAGWNYVSFRDDNIRVDHKWRDGQLLFSRAVKPSALGDGKQRYYEVPFDKAVDKIVKNRKPVSRDHVFVSETPKPFADIGFARLPVMMGQAHIVSCYFGEGEGIDGKHLHRMKGNLKLLPKALEKPLMIIASESSPSDSVVAILKMKDSTGASVIVPVRMSGVGQVGADKVDAHIALTMFGKKNTWKNLVANALKKESNGGIGIFYIDHAESDEVLKRLGRETKGLGGAGLQSPRQTETGREAFNFGKSEVQFLSLPRASNVIHSIADFGSPVKGVGAQTDSHQFKRWFGGSKVVDANGEPLVVYHDTNSKRYINRKTGEDWDLLSPEERAKWESRDDWDEHWEEQDFYAFDDRNSRSTVEFPAHFFTPVPDPYHEYGKRRIAAYLSMRKPAINPEIHNRSEEGAGRREMERLKAEGYDGIIRTDDDGKVVEYAVFDPSQIKSAMDNIGTFDPGNNDIRFSRGTAPEVEHVKLTRVADDAGQGEQTPGAIAASAELSRTVPTPLSQKGTRYVSLPVSEMVALTRYLNGHAEMATGRKLGVSGKASVKGRKLAIAADVLGVVDKSDMAMEKVSLQQHGFFQHEDPAWVATHTKIEAKRERDRSEDALSRRLEALADRRIAGKEPGGFAAGRKVFADQLAKVVMSMPHGQPGVLGAMQTVGGAIQKRIRGNEAEADAFLDWMKGKDGASGGPEPLPKDASTRKAEMFAAFLIMPQEMQARAPRWYDAMRSTIAGDATLRDAFRRMTARSMSEQGYAHLEAEIVRTIDEQYELNVRKLRAEANEPIKAGSSGDAAKEKLIISADDRMGAAVVRVDAKVRMYEQAQKAVMAAAKTPEEKARIKQATDMFLGQIAQAKNQAEISRTAWERGRDNADLRYLYRMVDLINEATVRDGLKMQDLSLYLDQQRVIETRGLSGSRGQSARQAQLVIDAMKRRLGGDFAKVEAFARKFHGIHEQELLNNPLLEKILGKGTAEYWRSQTSYVTTKRNFSPEELAEIEAARRTLAASGAAGGDTVIGQMFKYCGRPQTTAKLKGSFADKQEVMSATFEKVAEVQRFLRRSEYVIRLRDMLKIANVEGVHDFASGKNEFPRNNRYGSISYMENGQKRTLVVPKEIADGFERGATYDTGMLKICAGVNNFARQLWIDWNPVYWQRNISRNAGSMEMNMPSMRESIVKRGARFVFPGLAPVTEIAMTHLVRHLPERMSLPLRRMWGEHTALYYAPKAKRMAMWLTDHNEMQKKLWAAEKRGDLGAVTEMLQDQRDMLDALKGNMLVGLSAGKASGTAGFLDESVRTLGKTMQREMRDFEAMPKWRKALESVNIFRKNAEQQVFEDVMAKFSAYLHDRAEFGKTNNRTIEESGLAVKKNVSIGEGERKGKDTGTVQAIFQPFWNMVEKGVVRNVKAYGERPGETFQKAAWRIAPMILHGLVGSGAVAAWILKANGGDEEKAKAGPLGDVYRYARDAQRAYQNCSNYVRENYHVTPLWTDGYTSIVIGMPLTDEERLLKPVARFVTDAASVAAGTKEQLEISGFLSDAFGTVAPDFKMAGAMVTLLDDTVHALVENPTDYYTGGQKYDRDLHAARNESWGMRGRFAAAMAKRLWNDFGGRNVLPVERGGVDNGLGTAPGWVAKMVNDIPVASPILRSFVKVQVGSPKRDAVEITDAEKRRSAVIGVLAKELFNDARKAGRDVSLDVEDYIGRLQKWEKTYGFTPDELARIEAKYLNAWRDYEGAQWRADGEREKMRSKAEKLGLDAASLWLDFD